MGEPDGGQVRVAADAQQVLAELRGERDKFQGLQEGLDRLGVGIDIVGADYRILYQNRILSELFGAGPGSTCYETYVGSSAPCDPCLAREAMASNKVVTQRAVAKNGREYEVTATPLPGPHGEADRVIELVTDITERRQAEARLRLLTSAIEQSIEGIAVSDLAGRVLFVNHAFARMHGYAPEEITGEHLSRFHSEEQLQSVEAAMSLLRSTGRFAGEVEHLRRDGTVFTGYMVNNLLYDEAGEAIGMLGTLIDVTVRKRAEERLRSAKREADFYLDLMTHDLTNFNAVLLGNLDLLARLGGDEARMKRSLDACRRQLLRSDGLISMVRDFALASRIQEQELGVIDLHALIASTIQTVRKLHPEMEVTVELAPEGQHQAAGTPLLESVFLNVIENAVKHASDAEVRLEISICSVESAGRDCWEITVADHGPGIPDALKEKVFQRFYRTQVREGTGLGLSLARTIVERLGGSIRAEDRVPGRPGEGTVIRIVLMRG